MHLLILLEGSQGAHSYCFKTAQSKHVGGKMEVRTFNSNDITQSTVS